MKGILQLRPSLPNYTFTWDVRKLLDYRSQSNNNELDLKALTFKTTTLLTWLLCQRAQTAYLLDPLNRQKWFQNQNLVRYT